MNKIHIKVFDHIHIVLVTTLVLGCGGETATTDPPDSTIPLSETAMSCLDVIHNYQVMEGLDAALSGGNLFDLPRELMRAGSLLSSLLIPMRTGFNRTSTGSESNEVGKEWVDWENHYRSWSDWSYSCENPPPKLRENVDDDDRVRTPTGNYGIDIPLGFAEETIQVINRLHDELNAVYRDTELLQGKVNEQQDDLGFSPVTLPELRQVFYSLLSSMKDVPDTWKRDVVGDPINLDRDPDPPNQLLEVREESGTADKPSDEVADLSAALTELYTERAKMYDTLVDMYATLWEESASYRAMGWGSGTDLYLRMVDVSTKNAKRDWGSAPAEEHTERAKGGGTYYANRAEDIVKRDWGSGPAEVYSKLAQQQTKLGQVHAKMAELTESVGNMPLTDLCVDLELLNAQARRAVEKARVKDLERLAKRYPALSTMCTFL